MVPDLTGSGPALSAFPHRTRSHRVRSDAIGRFRGAPEQHEVSDRADAELAADALSASRGVVRVGGFESEDVSRRHGSDALTDHLHDEQTGLLSRRSACGIVGDMNKARTRMFLAAWAVPSLAFAVIVGMGAGGIASAVMALIGAALVGAVIYLFLRAIYPANRG